MPAAEAQRALLAEVDRGVSLLGRSIDARQRLHEAEHARLRARLDDAFDADLRQQPTMSVEDVIEARRAYAAGIDAIHDASMRTRDALAADRANLRATRAAVARLRSLVDAFDLPILEP
jgi:hypothetical protein